MRLIPRSWPQNWRASAWLRFLELLSYLVPVVLTGRSKNDHDEVVPAWGWLYRGKLDRIRFR